MSEPRPFWELTRYYIGDTVYSWLSAILETSMESAMARFCQQPLSKLETVEREGNYWSAIEPQNRFGGNSSHEVWEQEEMPYLDIPHLTIYDNRKRDFQFWMSSVTGRNYKPLPAQLVLGSLH